MNIIPFVPYIVIVGFGTNIHCVPFDTQSSPLSEHAKYLFL